MDITMLGQIDNAWIGLLTLTPAVVAIILAFTTKNVYLSLGSGIYFGYVILNFFNWFYLDNVIIETNNFILFILAFIAPVVQIPTLVAQTLGNAWNAGIVMQVLFIGGVIQLLNYTGGAKLLAGTISKFAKTPKSSQFVTWVLGLLIFFDDYANALIVGPIMRPIIDKMKISREKFAFIIDATAAPIAGIAIVSTWVGYEVGLIQTAFDGLNSGIDVSGFSIFVQSIPFRFYNILMLIFIVLTIYLSRDFGSMYEAEKLAAKGKKTPGMFSIEETDVNEETKTDIDVNIIDGILPIVTLVLSAFAFFLISGYLTILGGSSEQIAEYNSLSFYKKIVEVFSNADASVVLFQAAFLTLVVMFIRGKIKKQFTFDEGSSVVIKGSMKLLSTVFILLCAWSLGSIISSLGADEYLTNVVPEGFPYYLIPAIGFILSGFIAFSTGTSFGTMGILIPFIIPIAYKTNSDMEFIVIAVSSILTGATFGDHCSPISDTTILSSAGAGCNHIEHVRTQMPYALLIGGFSIVAYIVVSIFVSSLLITYLIAFVSIVIISIILVFVLKTYGKDPREV